MEFAVGKYLSKQHSMKHQDFQHSKWMVPALQYDPFSCMCGQSNTALCVISRDLPVLGIQSQHHNLQFMGIQDITDDEITATQTTHKAGIEMQFSSGYDELI